jgi:hypothetical protein
MRSHTSVGTSWKNNIIAPAIEATAHICFKSAISSEIFFGNAEKTKIIP